MQKIKNVIKNSSLFGFIYLGIMRMFLAVLQRFVKVKQHQIMFASYSGRQISDTPLAAFEILRDDPDFADFNFIWAVNEPDQFADVPGAKMIKMDSMRYFWYLLQSKYWVSNASIERLIPFHHPKNVYIQFWHGIPLKTLGHAEPGLPKLVQKWYDEVEIDYLFANGPYDAEKLHELFPKTQQVVEHGQLRKWLSDQAKQQAPQTPKTPFNTDKPVLLYVPTYRNDAGPDAFLTAEQLKTLMQTYQVVYRGHYFSEHLSLPGLINGNDFDLYDLFAEASLLITDYSSVFFDFAYWQKPIYLYEADLNDYQAQRGFYFDPHTLGLPIARDFDALEKALAEQSCSKTALVKLEQRFDPHPTAETIKALRACFV
ncbi:hypothetical protein D3P96_05870 [Weissella viridescens]|uniref:Uncharacterized protein n=1 Tax=Weissella viridescens TaxID=1629 RepID=A0A3P2RER0_WEIVI|nr:CDP-glycerol glycerophosphotransferase family protein [Weissella viridescens]RRG17681.1 hypothetical protein D3P96_05870 [Weissella viridescens]